MADKTKMNKYARTSDLAYKQQRSRKKYLKDHNLNYDIDEELSDAFHAVLKDNETGEVVIAGRGTNFQGKKKDLIKDLGTDALIAFGLSRHSKRNKDLKNLVEKVKEKHNKAPVLTGHSLAGKIAAGVAEELGLEAHVFNQGSSPYLAQQRIRFVDHQKEKARKIHRYHIGSDIISNHEIETGAGNVHIISKKPGATNPHSIENFFGEKKYKKKNEPLTVKVNK